MKEEHKMAEIEKLATVIARAMAKSSKLKEKFAAHQKEFVDTSLLRRSTEAPPEDEVVASVAEPDI